MRKLEFCQHFVHLQRKPICFDGRPYLPPIYEVTDRNLVLRCSRQTEKSTFLVNTILYEACRNPGVQMLFVCPRMEQAMFGDCIGHQVHRESQGWLSLSVLRGVRNRDISNQTKSQHDKRQATSASESPAQEDDEGQSSADGRNAGGGLPIAGVHGPQDRVPVGDRGRRDVPGG